MRCKARTCCSDSYLLPCDLCSAPRPVCAQEATHATGGKVFCDLHYPLWKQHSDIVKRIRNIRRDGLESDSSTRTGAPS